VSKKYEEFLWIASRCAVPAHTLAMTGVKKEIMVINGFQNKRDRRGIEMDLIGTRTDIAQKLKDLVESKRDADGTAVSAAFIKDGALVAAFACGTQDGDPVKPATVDDLYCVGSVSKIYCALAVMKLVEMGKVGLDKPVVEYLPRFTMKDERYKQITLRMCLNHSSGLPGTGPKNVFCTKWVDGGDERWYDYISRSKLKAAPGDYSVYCNDGFTLAQLVVTEVSGIPYIQFVQAYITAPAGAVSACSGEAMAQGRMHIRENGKPEEYVMTIGSGGILTAMTDCARIGYLFIESKDVISQESLEEMDRPQGKTFIPHTMS